MRARVKSIHIRVISWVAEFESVRGSYYDYVARIYSPSEAKEQEIRNELVYKGWEEVETADSLLRVFVKDRHIVRMFRVW